MGKPEDRRPPSRAQTHTACHPPVPWQDLPTHLASPLTLRVSLQDGGCLRWLLGFGRSRDSCAPSLCPSWPIRVVSSGLTLRPVANCSFLHPLGNSLRVFSAMLCQESHEGLKMPFLALRGHCLPAFGVHSGCGQEAGGWARVRVALCVLWFCMEPAQGANWSCLLLQGGGSCASPPPSNETGSRCEPGASYLCYLQKEVSSKDLQRREFSAEGQPAASASSPCPGGALRSSPTSPGHPSEEVGWAPARGWSRGEGEAAAGAPGRGLCLPGPGLHENRTHTKVREFVDKTCFCFPLCY